MQKIDNKQRIFSGLSPCFTNMSESDNFQPSLLIPIPNDFIWVYVQVYVLCVCVCERERERYISIIISLYTSYLFLHPALWGWCYSIFSFLYGVLSTITSLVFPFFFFVSQYWSVLLSITASDYPFDIVKLSCCIS